MVAVTPKTYEEIRESLRLLTPESKVIGGGTDYIIRLHAKASTPDYLCYLGHVKELCEITEGEEELTIGAYATMTELEHHPVIKSRFPALSDSASDVGSLQIRNRATIGGNIGNASPAGDLLPVLYLYEAKVDIIGPEGIRTISIHDVIERPGKTTLSYQEAILRIRMPYPSFHSAFVKLGTRKKVTISRIGIALGISQEDDIVIRSRIWIGAISVKPVELTKAEEFLIGKSLSEENMLAVAEILSQYIMEHTPEEFDRDYKVFSAKGIVLDVFGKLHR